VTHEELIELIATQLDELDGEDGVIVRPESVTNEQFEAALKEVEGALFADNRLTSKRVRTLVNSSKAQP
jgi:hypothetical protein